MRGAQLSELLAADPPGLGPALELVAAFDDALTHGLARPGEQRAAALRALAGAVAASPLGERVAEAVEKITSGSVSDEHLAALAAARSALLGSAHDALLDRLDGALGRERAAWPTADAPAGGPSGAGEAALAGCRSWLQELAIAGWRGVDHDLVSSSGQALEALEAAPAGAGQRRLAVLLDGLAAELRACCPVATMQQVPAGRWSDLWARALLLARAGGWSAGPAEPVSGRLLVLGVDVHEHATAVQFQVHAILEPAGGGPHRLVRTGVTAAKVDTIVGTAVWRLPHCQVLLEALAGHRALEITDLPLLPGGDLVWHEDRARPGDGVDPFATARLRLADALAAPVPPLDRHPVRISEPVLLEGYTAAKADDGGVTFDLDGTRVTVDIDRLPACGPLTPALLAASSACLGLLRWDAGRWLVQPLAVQSTVKRRTVAAHNGDWALGPTDPKVAKAEARAGDAVAVLRERAGRLLRR